MITRLCLAWRSGAELGGLLSLPDGWVGDAHNLYLELLAETGLVGFLAFAFLMIATMRTALKRYQGAQTEFGKIICFAVFTAMIGVLVHGTVDYLFHTTPQVATLFFLVLGILKAQTVDHLEASLHA
jgi:O-antigen ligase